MKFQILKQGDAIVLAVPELVEHITPSWFDLNWWRQQGQQVDSAPGRGESYFLTYKEWPLVWRHYKRGGLVARLSNDSYFWRGLKCTRAYREFELTQHLLDLGLPVPRPLAARVVRKGLRYRADLMTQRLPGVQSMADALENSAQSLCWEAIGQTIARFHRVGLDHVDLNIRNILLDGQGQVYLIDFDRCRLREPDGRWQQGNLARLERSLAKVFPARDFAEGMAALHAGYNRDK